MNQIEVSKFLKPRRISIPLGNSQQLSGDILIPDAATAIVVLLNGDIHSRHKASNLFLSRALIEKGISTLVVDLLTEDQQLCDIESGAHGVDVTLLENRIVEVIDWLALQENASGLKIGLFATDDAATAALLASIRRYKWISTIVSVNGRPDLVGNGLAELDCPVLLIATEQDRHSVRANKKAIPLLICQHEFSVVPGASSHFEEPGAVEELAEVSLSWFEIHLS